MSQLWKNDGGADLLALFKEAEPAARQPEKPGKRGKRASKAQPPGTANQRQDSSQGSKAAKRSPKATPDHPGVVKDSSDDGWTQVLTVSISKTSSHLERSPAYRSLFYNESALRPV